MNEAGLIKKAAQILRGAKSPLFLSGAGISAESGIPTFRGNEDLWKNFRAEATRGREPDAATMASLRPEELATPAAFHRDPALVWDWYNWRKKLISEKEPNAAHHAIVKIAQKLPTLLSVTQNVDGFHGLAGLNDILEMHGNIFRARCLACAAVHAMREDVLAETPCPTCTEKKLRPDIVWFGEQLPAKLMDKIFERLRICDAILVVGTSGQVYPAAGLAVEVRRREGQVIEINVEDGHKAYSNDIYIRSKAGDVLPQLAELI